MALEPIDAGIGWGREGQGGAAALTFGPRMKPFSFRVPSGRYTPAGLAAAASRAMAGVFTDLFWNCQPKFSVERGLPREACADWADTPVGDAGGGGAIELLADEEAMRFRFEYNVSSVVNGKYVNAVPCFRGALGNCGWLGLRFSLLFATGPNRDRSVGALLGFNRMEDYTSSPSQHRGATLGALPADGTAPAALRSPLRYGVEQAQGRAEDLRPSYRANRPPSLELPFRTRAQLVALAAPLDGARGECTVRQTGVFYVGPSRVSGKLESSLGIGNLVPAPLCPPPLDRTCRVLPSVLAGRAASLLRTSWTRLAPPLVLAGHAVLSKEEA
jgi:hypothetical protein